MSVNTAERLEAYDMVIDGRRVAAASGKVFESTNPFTGRAWATAPDGDRADVDRAVSAARTAFEGSWGQITGTERARRMRKLADLLVRDADRLAALETCDNGKLLREMRGQMAYMPEWFYFFAGLADKVHGEAIPSDRPNFFVYTRHEPVGVVGAIVPWNSPLLLMAWKLAPVHDDLVERVIERAKTIKLGDPTLPETEMGPLANQAQFDKVMGILDSARSEGATIAYGGRADPELGGYFVAPTVVTHARADMGVAAEEIFGPVVTVMPFSSEAQAVAQANASRYGLAAAVWTKDVHRAHRVAHRLRAGTVWVNAYRVVAPNVPFGGFNFSGLGRENGIDAVRSYTETKAVWIELTGATRDPFTIG